ncbi:hypothetical protein [Prosthecobacter sp.]|uniref:hypothetical protein n=1 Tax=Prosthecobacter sp. TaxID=1965333 RepID=UPI002487D973|nr:hypothetical protein [Prosthecobacter sp.]MDI1312503.1 hypothetical protein [Prosthecobacter sp.]
MKIQQKTRKKSLRWLMGLGVAVLTTAMVIATIVLGLHLNGVLPLVGGATLWARCSDGSTFRGLSHQVSMGYKGYYGRVCWSAVHFDLRSEHSHSQ